MGLATHDIRKDELRVLTELIDALTPETTELGALNVVVLCKRAETFLSAWRSRICEKANAEYSDMKKTQPDRRAWPIGDIAVLTTYTPAGRWEFPPEIEEKAVALKAEQDQAKKLNLAKIIPASPVDPTKTTLFAISIKDTPE